MSIPTNAWLPPKERKSASGDRKSASPVSSVPAWRVCSSVCCTACMLSFSPRRDSGPGGRVHSATTLRTGGKAWHSFLFYGSKGGSSTLLLSFPDQYGFCSILISVRIDAKVTKISKKPYLCTPKNFKLREDEENKNNLPCYPVDIAFAGFL